MSDLEKITKTEFKEILKKSLDTDATEVLGMSIKMAENSPTAPLFSPTIHSLLDTMYHNALLYNRVDCIDSRKNVFYKNGDGLPVLKYSNNILKKKNVKGYE